MKKILVAVIFAALLAVVGVTYKRWEGQPPKITFDKTFTSLGRDPALKVKVEDAGTGLKQVSIHLKQKEKDTVLLDDSFAKVQPLS